MPSMSVALSTFYLGEVTTIIENPRPIFWQPFDPRQRESYRRLEEFGIRIRVPLEGDP